MFATSAPKKTATSNASITAGPGTNNEFLRRHAQVLLRQAQSARTEACMPILRRLHGARILPYARLVELYRARASVQLKHLLRLLSKELGYADWATCKRGVDALPSSALDRFRVDSGGYGDQHRLWFADPSEAQAWQRQHGGRLIAYGNQALLLCD